MALSQGKAHVVLNTLTHMHVPRYHFYGSQKRQGHKSRISEASGRKSPKANKALILAFVATLMKNCSQCPQSRVAGSAGSATRFSPAEFLLWSSLAEQPWVKNMTSSIEWSE